ncbi:hypothetical protein BDZ91DRAFT_729662 [Kalaharituber pfeilii]|nr:hypothetical protein BDZ91DRAFT_729662 [Kalaharituber pfeilii]
MDHTTPSQGSSNNLTFHKAFPISVSTSSILLCARTLASKLGLFSYLLRRSATLHGLRNRLRKLTINSSLRTSMRV